MRVLAKILSVAATGLLVACSIGESTYVDVETPARVQSAIRTCDSPYEKPDLAKLTPCGEGKGKGHCYDGMKTYLGEELDPCPGGGGLVCVPDVVLAANGTKLKSCTFFLGSKPGACMPLLLKDAAAHANELQRDVCAEDERCLPCVSPLDGQDTHLCDPIGVHEKACVGGGASALPPTCCHGSGVCMNPDAAPADSRGDLQHDTCPGDKLCAPRAMVEGQPVKCDVAGVSGVCLDLCFASMLGPVGKTMRGGCGPTEICMPCAIGKSRGMPGCE